MIESGKNGNLPYDHAAGKPFSGYSVSRTYGSAPIRDELSTRQSYVNIQKVRV